jgi:hypothetical protein
VVLGPIILNPLTLSTVFVLIVVVLQSIRSVDSMLNAHSMFTRSKYGTLGKGKRVPLPECALRGVEITFLIILTLMLVWLKKLLDNVVYN